MQSFSLREANQKVKENGLPGYVTDFFGRRVQEARAPFTGAVMYFTATAPVFEGEPPVNIGEIRNKSK